MNPNDVQRRLRSLDRPLQPPDAFRKQLFMRLVRALDEPGNHMAIGSLREPVCPPEPKHPHQLVRQSEAAWRAPAVATVAFVAVIMLGVVTAWIVGGTGTREVGGDAPQNTTDRLPPGWVVISTDHEFVVIDTALGTVDTRSIAELEPGDALTRLVRRGPAVVFHGKGPNGPAVFSLIPTAAEPPSLIGDAWLFLPSAHQDRVWLGTRDLVSSEYVRSLAAVSEVTLDGTIVVPDIEPPEGRTPVAAVENGLLFQDDDHLDLWDPLTGEYGDSVAGAFPIATSPTRLATCGPCDAMNLIDLETGIRRVVPAPIGVAVFDGYGGQFSPDNTKIAVRILDREGPITAETRISVAIVDFAQGTIDVVPDSSQTEYGTPLLAWTDNSEWLYIAERNRLVGYRLADGAIVTFDLPAARPFNAMAAR